MHLQSGAIWDSHLLVEYANMMVIYANDRDNSPATLLMEAFCDDAGTSRIAGSHGG
jgi:hypothetical protein